MASTLEEVFKVPLYSSDRPVEEEFPDVFELVTHGYLREYYPQAQIRDCFALDSQPYAQMSAMVWREGDTTPQKAKFELFPSGFALKDTEHKRLILPFAGARYDYSVTIFDFEPPMIQVAKDLRWCVFGDETTSCSGIIPGELTLADNPICFNQILNVGEAKDILVYGKSITMQKFRNVREFAKKYGLMSLRILGLDTDAVIIPTDLAATLLGISETSLRYDLAAALRATAMQVHEHINRYAAHM